MSYTSIQTFLSDVLGLRLSTGQLAKIIQKFSACLAPSHAEVQAVLPEQAVMNIDETGHPENGKDLWTWGFHVPGPKGFTFFHIDPSRSTKVLYEFLGETFSGIIGVGEDQDPLPALASSRADAAGKVGACRPTGTTGGVGPTAVRRLFRDATTSFPAPSLLLSFTSSRSHPDDPAVAWHAPRPSASVKGYPFRG